MAIADTIDLTIPAGSFEGYQLGKADGTNSLSGTTLDHDNLVTRSMADSIYHFAQTKTSMIPALFKQDGDFDNTDFFSYNRVGKMGWDFKTKAGQTTPLKEIEHDKRSVTSVILHTGFQDDMDYRRRRAWSITEQMQIEWTWSLARAKEHLAQYAFARNVIGLTETVILGYKGNVDSSVVSFPDSQLRVVVKDSTATSSANVAIGSLDTEQDRFIDDLTLMLEDTLLDISKCVIVATPYVRRRLKDITSFRNRESTVHLGYREGPQGENSWSFWYKDLFFVFLKRDAHLNLKALFNGKYFNAKGEIVASTATVKKQLPADLATSNYEVLIVFQDDGMCWKPDSGGIFYGNDVLPQNSFARITYMKTAYGAGRIDESKVFLFLHSRDHVPKA